MREYGSEHPAIILPDGYFRSFENLGGEVTYLRCGREALLFVAYNVKSKLLMQGCSYPVILFPAYCCWSMSAPFEKAGWKVIYYRLNQDLTIDIDYLKGLLSNQDVKSVLTMNFYGSADTGEAVRTIKEFDSQIRIIEDFSHCSFSFASIFNMDVDYYVSSLRKSIGIPDGAIVISKEQTDKTIIEPEVSEFASKRFKHQTLKASYNYSKNQVDKSHFLQSLKECENELDEFDAVHDMSSVSHQMLNMMNGGMIATARRENMKHLWVKLNGRVEMVPELERSFSGAPFSLPILVKGRDRIQNELAKKGLYTQLLWPISDEAQSICPVSKRMSEEMLSIPIDQRFSWNDIEDMANLLLTTI